MMGGPAVAPSSNMPTTDSKDALKQVAGYAGGLDGTSVAAPLVTGLAVLLKTAHPTWQGPELAARIESTADPVEIQNPLYAGKLGRGRVNVMRALANDDAARRLGPLTLEVSDVGFSPEVRVRTADGVELSRFSVGERGDTRGVRAAFVRWQGVAKPDIVVTIDGDTHGTWRVYRPDGLLIAAGQVAGDVKGGLNVAAQDLASVGRDQLFFGERGGSRAWLVSSQDGKAQLLHLFREPVTNINALSVTRPVPSFLVTGESGMRDIRVVGNQGNVLVSARATSAAKTGPWTARRGVQSDGGAVYDLSSQTGHVVFINDASGLHATKGMAVTVDRWAQIPNGIPTDVGWRYVETWPR